MQPQLEVHVMLSMKNIPGLFEITVGRNKHNISKLFSLVLEMCSYSALPTVGHIRHVNKNYTCFSKHNKDTKFHVSVFELCAMIKTFGNKCKQSFISFKVHINF